MAHEKVFVVCEDMCMEEGMTKEELDKKLPKVSTTEPNSDIWFKHSENLLNANRSETLNNVTYTVNGSKVTINGSNATEAHSNIAKYLIGIFSAGTYKIRCFQIGGTFNKNTDCGVALKNSSDSSIVAKTLSNNEIKEFTLTEDTNVYFTIYDSGNNTFNNYEVGIVIQKGVSDIPEYIPHIDNSIQLKNSVGQYMPFMGEMGTIERSFYDSATNSYCVMYTTGFMICCHTVKYVGAINSPWGYIHISNYIEVPKFPVRFNTIYSTSYGTTGNNAGFILNGGVWSNEKPSGIYLATGSPVSSSDIYATITTFGTWK